MHTRLLARSRQLAHGGAVVVAMLISGASATAGDQQSPIDIEPRAVVVRRLPDLAPTYATRTTLTLVNTDDPSRVPALDREWATLRANVPAGSFVMVGHQQYNLLQFHFHTPSEHKVNGRASPMEVHFVHLRDGALPCDRGALLVVGAKIVRGARHRELDKIFGLPSLPIDAASPPVSIPDFDLNRVLPSLRGSWRYAGSLTAPASFEPTCSSAEGSVEEQLASDTFPENVQWILLTQSIEMSRAQIHRFRALFEEGNSRATQPIEHRTILRDVADHGTH